MENPDSSFEGARDDVTEQVGLIWQQIKAPLIVPLLRLLVFLCLLMSVMLFIEKVYMAIVILLVKIFGKKPEKRYKWEPIRDDLEMGTSANYPMVLVQIPMYNEKEVLLFHFLLPSYFFFFVFFHCLLAMDGYRHMRRR